MQTSTSRILVLSVLFDSIVQRGERKRSHLGSLVRKFPDPVLASPWIPDRKQSVTPSFHAAFSVVGNWDIWLPHLAFFLVFCELVCTLTWGILWISFCIPFYCSNSHIPVLPSPGEGQEMKQQSVLCHRSRVAVIMPRTVLTGRGLV